jgi:hypothetical protein
MKVFLNLEAVLALMIIMALLPYFTVPSPLTMYFKKMSLPHGSQKKCNLL